MSYEIELFITKDFIFPEKLNQHWNFENSWLAAISLYEVMKVVPVRMTELG